MDNEKKEEDHIANLGKWLALLAASSAAKQEQYKPDWQEFTFLDGHTEMVDWNLAKEYFASEERAIREKEERHQVINGLGIFFLIGMAVDNPVIGWGVIFLLIVAGVTIKLKKIESTLVFRLVLLALYSLVFLAGGNSFIFFGGLSLLLVSVGALKLLFSS